MGHLHFTVLKLLRPSKHTYTHVAHTLNILAVAKMLSRGVAHKQPLMIDHAEHCIHLGVDYLIHQLITTTVIFDCVRGCTLSVSPENVRHTTKYFLY